MAYTSGTSTYIRRDVYVHLSYCLASFVKTSKARRRDDYLTMIEGRMAIKYSNKFDILLAYSYLCKAKAMMV